MLFRSGEVDRLGGAHRGEEAEGGQRNRETTLVSEQVEHVELLKGAVGSRVAYRAKPERGVGAHRSVRANIDRVRYARAVTAGGPVATSALSSSSMTVG